MTQLWHKIRTNKKDNMGFYLLIIIIFCKDKKRRIFDEIMFYCIIKG